MSKIKDKLWLRIVLFILFVIFSCGSFVGLSAVNSARVNNYFTKEWEDVVTVETNREYRYIKDKINQTVFNEFMRGIDNINYLKKTCSVDEIDAYFEIYIGNKLIESTYGGEKLDSFTEVYFEYVNEPTIVEIYNEQISQKVIDIENGYASNPVYESESVDVVEGNTLVEFTVTIYMVDGYYETIKQQVSDNLWIRKIVYERLLEIIIISAILTGIALLLAVILIITACKTPVKNVWYYKLPWDILLPILVFGIFCVVNVFNVNFFIFLIISSVCFFLLLLFIKNIKMEKWWENTVIYKTRNVFVKTVKAIWDSTFGSASTISVVIKVVIAMGTLFIMQLIALMIINSIFNISVFVFISFVVEVFVGFPIVLIFSSWMKKLSHGANEISKGNLEYKVDTSNMVMEFKTFGQSINNMGDGINIAIEDKVKSERLKTELITNVSHDIKTPLTSIINYVDLIKKEEVENDNIKDYVEVLERQSLKLKRLITDLVEASKLSTGNVQTQLVPMDMAMVITQLQGEYYDRLKEKDLELCCSGTEKPVMIMADGKHLQRVFDNIINNIIKYSLEGTRVYLELKKVGDKAEIQVKNMSKYQLNITEEELMERFVRGDKSRTTEGNGLGLSIARSLINAQNGELSIKIDGDLFKVIMSFELTTHI